MNELRPIPSTSPLNQQEQRGDKRNDISLGLFGRSALAFAGLTLILLTILSVFLANEAQAAPGLTALTVSDNPDGTRDYTMTLQALFIMTALSLIPAFVVMMTSFTRIIVVMSILRQAIGLQQAPSNQIIIGISLFLSMFIMAPVFDRINETALQPYLNETMSARDAFENAKVPLRAFMLSQTRVKDLETFVEIGGYQDQVQDTDDVPWQVLVPAFVTSELKTAFQIGFMLFIPFLILDLVVASVLMAMGMMMLSPMIVSLPFKLMLFVLVDGWNLIFGTLATSFGMGVV